MEVVPLCHFSGKFSALCSVLQHSNDFFFLLYFNSAYFTENERLCKSSSHDDLP